MAQFRWPQFIDRLVQKLAMLMVKNNEGPILAASRPKFTKFEDSVDNSLIADFFVTNIFVIKLRGP